METEELEAQIVRRVYGIPSYAHAENVLLRLRELERRLPHREAVEILYQEVMEGMPAVVYCATCRAEFLTEEERPPYGVIHVMSQPPIHLHPVTRDEVEPVVAV